MPNSLTQRELAKLKELVLAKDFDSEAALALDNQIMESLGCEEIDYQTLEPLDDHQANYFAAWWLEGEVNNGGFDQFFLNKGPTVARTALKFVRKRIPRVAHLLERAIECVGPAAMVGSDELQERLCEEDEDLTAALGELDTECFGIDPYPNFIEVRLRYALEHSASFFT